MDQETYIQLPAGTFQAMVDVLGTLPWKQVQPLMQAIQARASQVPAPKAAPASKATAAPKVD